MGPEGVHLKGGGLSIRCLCEHGARKAASGVSTSVAEFGEYEQASEIIVVHPTVDDVLLVPFDNSASTMVNVVPVAGSFRDYSL